MKPAWDQLGDEYKDSTTVLIGDADCTSTGKELCDANEVRGYPTIKYFSAETGPKGADYSGARSFQFITSTLLRKRLRDDDDIALSWPKGCAAASEPIKALPQALKTFVDENLEVKCTFDNLDGCSDKEKEFMEKWKVKSAEEVKSQKERLQGMSGGSMKPELKKWLHQRLNILKQL